MTTAEPRALAGSWESESLLNKAQLYSEYMHEYLDRGDPQCGLWSALSLELLSRAALAHVSPVLLADNKDWNNLYYALGCSPKKAKFVPKSIASFEVFDRLSAISPLFNEEIKSFCSAHIARRNAELHAADLAFDGLSTSVWLGQFYKACSALLQSMNRDLDEFFGPDRAKTAQILIIAVEEKSAQAVKGLIDRHRTDWNSKDADERKKLKTRANFAVWSADDGHTVDCPACGSPALVIGDPISPPKKFLDDHLVVETQLYLPSYFECEACDLKIGGLSQLTACGLSDTYIEETIYNAATYYGIDDINNNDDNNEPY